MSESVPLQGRVAAITGASSGIGQATAERFAREGMHLALAARSEGKLDTLATRVGNEHGVDTLAIGTDVTDPSQVERFADAVEDAYDGCDVVFANAGAPGRGRVEEISHDAFEETIDVNLLGAFRTAKAFLPLLQDRPHPASLVFTASVSGTMGMPGASAYCASKWGLRGFAQSLALEAADEGIRVSTINPGLVNTRWHADHPRGDDMIQPEDIAQTVVDLATLPATAMIDDVTVWPAKMYTE